MRNIEEFYREEISEEILLHQINKLKEALVKTALKKGIANDSVLQISEQLDTLILKYQKMK